MTELQQTKPSDRAAARIDGMSSAAGLGKVIPFARARRRGAETHVPPVTIAPADRPAPPPPGGSLSRQFAIVACSLAAHGVFLFAFWEPPRPLASVGLETITVEIVVGANAPAGVAPTPGENEVQSAAPVADATSDDRPDDRRDDKPDTPPQDREPATQPVVTADALADQPTGQVPVAAPKPATPKPAMRPNPSVPANAASGIGRGSSASDANYRGTVAAHLARHQQYPASARNGAIQGAGTVTFSIDGSGRVTAVGVVRGAGAAILDQELVAMVRRASPFPPPPSGQTMSFTVPVNFRLN